MLLKIFYGDDKGYVESLEFSKEKCHFCKVLKCCQPFATKAYLLQHLLDSHFKNTNNIVSLKCCWDNCNQVVEVKHLKIHLLRHL